MAEYYRILSYLYRYDKKIKADCKGFVKAEQKRNGLKITLQIDDERLMEEMRLELCFYEKGPDEWKIRKLDTLSPARHHEETVRFYPVEQMPEAFDIKKQYGVLLFYQDYFFYGSVWIGDEIPVEELLRAHLSALNPEYEPVQSPEAVPVPNPEPAPNLEHMPKAGRESALEPESERKPEPGWEPVAEAEPELQREPELEPVPGAEPEAVPESESRQIPGLETQTDRMQTPELEQKPEWETVSEPEAVPGSEPETVPESEAPMELQPKSERTMKPQPDEEISTDGEDLLTKMWIDTENKPRPVDNIFNPAFRSGYQIDREQLGDFSPEARKLADNQFLEKGYAMYHHLLAGKVMYAGKERYCVGVPGIYENRERYMAQLYQFPVFLSMTENRIKTGGFRYWLHLLQE